MRARRARVLARAWPAAWACPRPWKRWNQWRLYRSFHQSTPSLESDTATRVFVDSFIQLHVLALAPQEVDERLVDERVAPLRVLVDELLAQRDDLVLLNSGASSVSAISTLSISCAIASAMNSDCIAVSAPAHSSGKASSAEELRVVDLELEAHVLRRHLGDVARVLVDRVGGEVGVLAHVEQVDGERGEVEDDEHGGQRVGQLGERRHAARRHRAGLAHLGRRHRRLRRRGGGLQRARWPPWPSPWSPSCSRPSRPPPRRAWRHP